MVQDNCSSDSEFVCLTDTFKESETFEVNSRAALRELT